MAVTTLKLDARVKAWQHQPEENDQEFIMFTEYLFHRDLTQIASKFFAESLAPASDVHKLCKAKLWNARARAYDNWVVQQRDDAVKLMVEGETKEVAKRRIKLLRGLYRLIERNERNLRTASSNDPAKISAHANLIKKWDELSRKMEADNMAAASTGASTDSETEIRDSKRDLRERMTRIAEKNAKNAPPAENGASPVQ